MGKVRRADAAARAVFVANVPATISKRQYARLVRAQKQLESAVALVEETLREITSTPPRSAVARVTKGLSMSAEIRRHRERLGLTQREMAELLETSFKTYQKWEGNTAPKPAGVARLQKVFRMSRAQAFNAVGKR